MSEPELIPVLDTWRNWSHAGSWQFRLSAPGDNAQHAAQIEALLEALQDLVRPARITLDGSAQDGWSQELSRGTEPPDAFTERLLGAIREAPVPVRSATLALDLKAWARTAPGGPPELGWLARLATLDLSLEPEGYAALWLHHTLFVPGRLHGDSNDTLATLNAPLLSEILQVLASLAGPLEEVSGLPGVGPLGFGAP